MIFFIMYVCVASRWLSVRGIHWTGTIFLIHEVDGRGETSSRRVVSTQCAVGLIQAAKSWPLTLEYSWIINFYVYLTPE